MACVIMDFIKAMQDNDAALCVEDCVCAVRVSVCMSVCVRTPIQSTPCVTNKFIKRSQCLLQNIIRARGGARGSRRQREVCTGQGKGEGRRGKEGKETHNRLTE